MLLSQFDGGRWMKRISGLFLTVAAVLVPMAVQAQKPTDIAETRSADVYMGNAQGKALASEKRELYQKALDVAIEGLKKYPTNSKLYFQIGKANHQLGNYLAADSAFTKA